MIERELCIDEALGADRAQALWWSSWHGAPQAHSNLAGTISGKLAAACNTSIESRGAQRLADSGAKRPSGAEGSAEKARVAFWHRTWRARVPVSREVLLAGQHLVRCGVLGLSLALMYLLVARSAEIFATTAGSVHPVHFLRRNITFDDGDQVLRPTQGYRATRRVKVVFRGHKGGPHKTEQGSITLC